VGSGVLRLHLGFEAIEFGEDRSLLQLNFGFGKVCFGLTKVRGALLRIGAILGHLLFDLVAEVLILRFGVAGQVELLGAIEDSDEIAFLDTGPVGDEFGEGHGAALSPYLRHQNFGGVNGLNQAGDTDFASDALTFGWNGVGRVGDRRS